MNTINRTSGSVVNICLGSLMAKNQGLERGFGGLEVAYWLLVPKFAGSNPAKAVGFFRAKKSSARIPSVPCRRFTACKRSLNVTWKSGISGKIHRPFLAHIVPTLATRISRRRLVVKVGTSKKVCIYSSTADC
jgi:hypothetical protein